MAGGWTNSTRRTRLPTDWAKRRRRILRRDAHRCCWTDHNGRCTHPATDVDHITPGDNHHDTNLQSLCAAHHAAKTHAEALAARAALPSRKRATAPHPGLLSD